MAFNVYAQQDTTRAGNRIKKDTVIRSLPSPLPNPPFPTSDWDGAPLVGVDATGNRGDAAIALQMEQHFFIGADNGLFGLITDKTHQHLIELIPVVREIQGGLARSGEDGDPVGGLQIRGDEFLRGRPCVHQICELHVDIVEKKPDEMIGSDNRRGALLSGRSFRFRRGNLRYCPAAARLLNGELRNDLRFAFIEKLKILLTKRAHCLAVLIAHDDRNFDQRHLRLEDSHFILCADLLCDPR